MEAPADIDPVEVRDLADSGLQCGRIEVQLAELRPAAPELVELLALARPQFQKTKILIRKVIIPL